ncbi:MAG TPA: hypothetical protein VE621_00755, partial [Bryobacteraceae bacterium]|nr:hypothetical protein [Bryobacteraceae bacterium]
MTRCLAFIILSATLGLAQRNEISLQFGGTLTQRRTIPVPAQFQSLLGTNELREDNGLAGGIVYRVRL